ncbi:MAG: glycosyltransferase [Paludibacter sp.]|nr:glycosyltransferase [Paludibacter sp.]
MITYNHESFIAKAIEGVLMQQTTFNFELIISDDCSTDLTRKICEKYRHEHQQIINLILPNNNLGIIRNSIETLCACSGKYIAICEGDDYWIDPFKLQKQVDFLEQNQNYGFVHTNYNVVNKNNTVINTYRRLKSKYYNTTDVFELILNRKYEIASLTVLFRKQLFLAFVEDLSHMNLKMTDLPMWLEFSKHSKVKYLNEITANYRLLENSASHFADILKTHEFDLNKLEILSCFAKKYGVRVSMNKLRSKSFANILKACYLDGNKSLSRKFYANMIHSNVFAVFNPRPLLFLLGVHHVFFYQIIEKLKQSKYSVIRKHFL